MSPPLSPPPDYELRGKKLKIFWEDTLMENSTYQFNFGKSVVDVNEGNANSELIYVFSTGDAIDSLSITGRVLRSSDNKPASAAFAMIYTGTADSLPLTGPPSYFAQTDSLGYFKIRYLPEGEFKIFSLLEENNNYRYDGPPEEIAFLDHTVESSLNDSTDLILLRSFIEKDTVQYIKSQSGTDYGYYEVVFNIPATDPSIQFADPETGRELEAVNYLNTGKDSLRSWVNFPERDNFEEVAVYISDDTTFADTAFWYIEIDPKYREEAKLKASSNTTRSKLDLEKTFSLDFNNPLIEVDTALVFFLEDSVQVYPKQFKRLNLNRKIEVYYPFKASASYIFKARTGAFRGIFGSYSDSISIPFSLQDDEYYGSLTVSVSADSGKFAHSKILHLLDEKNTVVAERTFSEGIKTDFKRLTPGNYSLKIIYDENQNGKWDTGIYRKDIQPEKLVFYPEAIEVRSNWSLDIEWTPSLPFE